VIPQLLGLAGHYKEQDPDLLEDLLGLIWAQAGALGEETKPVLRERCLKLAEQLDRYDKERFILARASVATSLPSYVPRLLEITADRKRGGGGRRDDEPLRRLRDLPAIQLMSHLEQIAVAARTHLPDDTWEAQRFVEILQRLGAWEQAAALADEILASVPDDTEHAVQRDSLGCLVAICRVQAALAAGRPKEARGALTLAHSAANRLAAAREQERARQRYPWDEEP
jgi:hypothetical protein